MGVLSMNVPYCNLGVEQMEASPSTPRQLRKIRGRDTLLHHYITHKIPLFFIGTRYTLLFVSQVTTACFARC